MIRFETVARSRSPWSMREKRARLVLSQSCSAFLSVCSFRLRIISLILSLSAAISPDASTAIERVRSPLVTAVATSAIERTWLVRFAASWLTLSVRSRHRPAAPGTRAWPPSLPSMPTSRAMLVTWSPKVDERLDHEVDRLGQRGDLALGVDGQLALEVALRHRGDDVGDAAHLVGQVGRHQVDVVGQILPGAADARHLRLAAELAFGADLAGHAGHLRGEAVELIDHDVDRVLELEDLALHVDGDLLGKVAPAPRRWSPRRCCGPGRSDCRPSGSRCR